MNIFKIILTILFILLTTGAFFVKPVMHKPAIVENADFTLASLEKPKVVTVKSDFETNLKPAEKQVVERPAPVVKRIVRTIVQQEVAPAQITPVEVKQVPVKTVQQANPVQAQKVEQKKIEPQKEEETVHLKVEEPPVKVVTKTINTAPLTEKEEIIAWNKWRSDLQNKVMRDAKINAPLGTTFYFSCTVDKFGNISNINTWSDNDYYTPLAKRIIKPVLSSYQNQAILKFPARTQRTITNVTGSFTMAFEDRFSTPADYSDYERIK